MIIKNELRNLREVKLLIFDIDQTLTIYNTIENLIIATLNHFDCSYNDICYNMVMNTFENALIQAETGLPFTVETLAICYEESMPFLKENEIEEIHFAQEMIDLECEFVKRAPLIDEVLEQLSKKYKIVCLTNWFEKPAREKLVAMGLFKYISKIYTCETNHAKPHENSYKYVIESENVLPIEALMIGDSMSDVLSSVYGIQSILVDYDNNKADSMKEFSSAVITEPMDLLELLNKRT